MDAKKPAQVDLLNGDIPRVLSSLAVPMTLGILLMMTMSLVDTFFVSQLGTKELAAMSFSFPVISLVTSIAFGLNVGATSAISRALGGGDKNAVRRLATHAILLALVVVALLSILGIVTQRALFRLLGADEAVLPLLEEYMTIWFVGVIFLVVPMVGNGAIQAAGDARTPAKILAAAALINLVFDPVLIFGWGPIPALGLTGAALATVLARALTTLLSLWVLAARLKLLDIHWPSLRELWGSWRSILSVGLPASISNALVPLAAALLTGLVAGYGSQAVAAFGLGSRLDSLLLIPPMAIASALTPFIGQNWGAHRVERVGEAVRLARRFVLVWGAVGWVLLFLFGRQLAGLFSGDAAVIERTSTYLLVIPLAYGAHGVVSVISAAFNAVDRAVRSTVLSAARSLGLAVPLAWLGANTAQEPGLFAGIASATALSALLASAWARGLLRPKQKKPTMRGAATVRGLGEELAATLDALLGEVAQIRDVVASARPINTIGFYVGGREIGHAHRTGHIDLHFPPAVHDQLLHEKRAAHHRHHHDTSWVTHRLRSREDVGEALWLVKLAAVLAHMGHKGCQADARERAELLALSPSPALLAAIRQRFLGEEAHTKAA